MRTIFACAKSAGMDKDAINDLAERETGTRSLKALSDGQLQIVVSRMQSESSSQPGTKRTKSTKAHVRKVYAVWWALAEAGAVKPGHAALNAFICNPKFQEKWGEEVTDVEWLSVERAHDVTEALKAIAKRKKVGTVK
jgi:hypothetical protein